MPLSVIFSLDDFGPQIESPSDPAISAMARLFIALLLVAAVAADPHRIPMRRMASAAPSRHSLQGPYSVTQLDSAPVIVKNFEDAQYYIEVCLMCLLKN